MPRAAFRPTPGVTSLEVLDEVKGAALVGRRYEPLFPYFRDRAEQGAFVVVADAYVSTEEGTGLVHQAPAFGEDDYRVLRDHDIEAFVCPVGMDGVFTQEVTDFAGQFVKDADADIMDYLKASGALYDRDVIEHSYPFCYRSDTPLIYRAVPSWYVRVTDLIDDLVAANDEILWVPEHIKEGRFGNWLKGAVDWAISRNRVWGTPLPIWENGVTGNRICIGSIDELERLTGQRVDDLHREFVDPLTFEIAGEEGIVLPRRGGARLLVRVRLDALCAAALPVREPKGLRAGLPGGVHRGRSRPDPRLVLHAHGARRCPLWETGVPQRHRQRPGDGGGRQEDVEEPPQLHAPG